MPRAAKGLNKNQPTSVLISARATEREAEKIKDGANEAALSVSRFVVTAAVSQAECGRPVPATGTTRLQRRAKVLQRLRREFADGTPEHAALSWATRFAGMLNGQQLASTPPKGAAEVLEGLRAQMTGHRHSVVVGSLGWASRMARWAEGIESGSTARREAQPPGQTLAAMPGWEMFPSLRWAVKANKFLEGVDGFPVEAPPPGAEDELQEIAGRDDLGLDARQRDAVQWAARLAALVRGPARDR